MYFKVLVLFTVFCLSGVNSGAEEDSLPSVPLNNSSKPVKPQGHVVSTYKPELGRNFTSIFSYWKPGTLMKLGRILNELTRSHESLESDLDDHFSSRGGLLRTPHRRKLKNKIKTITRRESSLIAPRKHVAGEDRQTDFDVLSTARHPSTVPFTSESGASLSMRPKGSVQKELVTMMFESMLDSIVDSWEIIVSPKSEDSSPLIQYEKTASEITFSSKKKKPVKPTKSTKRSKLDLSTDMGQVDPLHQSWWSSPDERAIVRFRNGNLYEGSISMKCMHGEGRFQWADGTVFLGQFKDNKMSGKGMIQWKDDTWYEGDFLGNLRHGKGLYANSREQCSYSGGWHCGAKHGDGVIYYSKTFKNSYDGDWVHNVRHGYGSREYDKDSGYRGTWDKNIREGTGLIIWPNHDFYRGEWKNGVMSGQGIYIWDTAYNNSMSLPSMRAYRGQWLKGQRNGYGCLNLGLGLGSYYKGEFKNNKKHGSGKLVSNNGLILQHKKIFIDDNIGTLSSIDDCDYPGPTQECKRMMLEEPYKFDICDSTVDYQYHIHEAIKNIDKQVEIRANIISDFIERNKTVEADLLCYMRKDQRSVETSTSINLEELIEFEESSLLNSVKCYEPELKDIYIKYATICNSSEVQFQPVLIRLLLWQFYYDCNIHDRGMTLIDIDKLYHRNPKWLSRSPHDPFEKIYLWQFFHIFISVACRLYANKKLPGPKPDTIIASAFRTFVENDVLPNVGSCKGRLVEMYGQFIPLKSLYELYQKIGEAHTVRDFLRAVRRPPHETDKPPPMIIEASDKFIPIGRNVYIIGDDMTFVADDSIPQKEEYNDNEDLYLFNFGNLSSKAIIKIFAGVFPQLCNKNKIMNLDIQLTYFEFFEVFIACAEASIRVKDEEMRWRERFSATSCGGLVPPLGLSTKTQK